MLHTLRSYRRTEMTLMNLDKLVLTGRPPWDPSPDATDVDVWEMYDFPIQGHFWLGGHLILFAVVAIAGDRSLWAYVPAAPDVAAVVESEYQFETDAQFREFMARCFASCEGVFAVARRLRRHGQVRRRSVGRSPDALLVAGARWYLDQAGATAAMRLQDPAVAETAGARSDGLARAALEALAGIAG